MLVEPTHREIRPPGDLLDQRALVALFPEKSEPGLFQPRALVHASLLERLGGQILAGEQVSACEAYEMGLVSRIVPRTELTAVVDALARTLAGFSPTALGLAKEAAATATGMEYGAALRYLRELITLVALSDDAREGIKAFFEKRAPNWTGH